MFLAIAASLRSGGSAEFLAIAASLRSGGSAEFLAIAASFRSGGSAEFLAIAASFRSGGSAEFLAIAASLRSGGSAEFLAIAASLRSGGSAEFLAIAASLRSGGSAYWWPRALGAALLMLGYGRDMSTLVVQAHPLEDSYSGALLAGVRNGLDSSGELYTVRRLGERERPTADDVADVNRLVLVYPTWWSGPPAMLLDWLQEMLASKAFGEVVRLQVVTTHGSSHLINRLQGEWGRRFLAERVAAACATGTELEWHALYKIDRRTPEEIEAFLVETERLFAATAGATA